MPRCHRGVGCSGHCGRMVLHPCWPRHVHQPLARRNRPRRRLEASSVCSACLLALPCMDIACSLLVHVRARRCSLPCCAAGLRRKSGRCRCGLQTPCRCSAELVLPPLASSHAPCSAGRGCPRTQFCWKRSLMARVVVRRSCGTAIGASAAADAQLRRLVSCSHGVVPRRAVYVVPAAQVCAASSFARSRASLTSRASQLSEPVRAKTRAARCSC